MPQLLVISHPEVVVDAQVPITDWGLNEVGRRRAAAFAASKTFANVTHIWASDERKALDTARILATPKTLQVQIDPKLGENDRSATGFLPRPQFEAAADAFFANPKVSFRGWETAVDAQRRIQHAVSAIIKAHTGDDLAIVTHGAVATLLWCAFSKSPIDRQHDQPGQGHFWRADLAMLERESGWRSIG